MKADSTNVVQWVCALCSTACSSNAAPATKDGDRVTFSESFNLFLFAYEDYFTDPLQAHIAASELEEEFQKFLTRWNTKAASSAGEPRSYHRRLMKEFNFVTEIK